MFKKFDKKVISKTFAIKLIIKQIPIKMICAAASYQKKSIC